MDGLIVGGWMGAAGRVETLLNIGRGAAKQKTRAVSPNVFRRSPGWAPRRRMHWNKWAFYAFRRPTCNPPPPPARLEPAASALWKSKEGGRSVSFSFAKKEPGKASATAFACDTIQCSRSSTTAQARPESTELPAAVVSFPAAGAFLSSKSVKATTPPKSFYSNTPNGINPPSKTPAKVCERGKGQTLHTYTTQMILATLTNEYAKVRFPPPAAAWLLVIMHKNICSTALFNSSKGIKTCIWYYVFLCEILLALPICHLARFLFRPSWNWISPVQGWNCAAGYTASSLFPLNSKRNKKRSSFLI